MALAGITCVGEFHYLHDGGNAFGEALIAAADEAGIRITLLDACYVAGGFGEPVSGAQARFSDGDAARWAERVVGAARGAARTPRRRDPLRPRRARRPARRPSSSGSGAAPLHFHLSEQRAENEACLAAHGCTPTQLLAEHGALGPNSTAPSTPPTSPTRTASCSSETTICMCPTTERDLADGIGPAGPRLSPRLRQPRGHRPLRGGARGRAQPAPRDRDAAATSRPPTLLRGATNHACLGWPEAGRIEPGALADLVTVGLDSVRLAGAAEPETLLESLVFAATAADVRSVIASGRQIVKDGRHTSIDVPSELADIRNDKGVWPL